MSFRVLLVLVLMVLVLMVLVLSRCAAQVNREEEHPAPDGHSGHGDAFFALRSCHQLLHGDSGEFFSPDYLCSNPPLWCNWTVQVDPGKRIHLDLEDMSPDDTCHLKRDQVHVDEPVGRLGVHEVLQRCWREAKYTTTSNGVTVVLLIAGRPDAPYRGFHGRYQAFGPPVIYNPKDGFAVGDETSGPVDEPESNWIPSPVGVDPLYDYYDPQVSETLRPSLGNYSHTYPLTAVPTAPASPRGTSWSGRDAADSPVLPVTPQQHHSPNHELDPSHRLPATVRRNAEEAPPRPEEAPPRPEEAPPRPEEAPPRPEEAAGLEGESVPRSQEDRSAVPEGENRPQVSEASDQRSEQTRPEPHAVEPPSGHKGDVDARNRSEVPHLPGDRLLEVAVELRFGRDVDESWDNVDESWDNVAASLLRSVKTLVGQRLEPQHAALTPKRTKRLSAGVLFILWLQTRRGPRSEHEHVHRVVDAAVQSLINASVALGGQRGTAAIMSVSTADVDECGTQLVLCDANADCENRFGTYSCRCRRGFLDKSRLGSGGTVCVDASAAGCSSGLSPETRGVYVLFFLLSSLVLALLGAAGMLYRRHRRGTFLVHCRRSSSLCPPDPNNNPHDHYSDPSHSGDMPPPPPPPRAGPREGWPRGKEPCPPVDLQLLRFSPLLPPGGYLEPGQGGKL